MTPDEKIRAMLDERGIDYQIYDGSSRICFYFDYSEQCGDFLKSIDVIGACVIASQSYLTPEQAIAATVGNRTDLSKRLREVTGLRSFAELFGFDWHDESDWSWHDVACAMADAIDATTEPDEATMLKLHDRMNAALLDYESAMGIEGGNGANTVPFVIEMHQIIEDAATAGVGTCTIVKTWTDSDYADHWRYSCSECGYQIEVGERDIATGNPTSHANFCWNCGRRCIGIKEVTE